MKEGKKLKIAAIICEYNPFHNGHIYHINKTKEALKADAIVALMSGNFVQRGIPSAFTKYERAKIACEYGCDLLIELPIFSSIAPADIFANNSIKILNSLNVINYLSFGSEDSLERLTKAYNTMTDNRDGFDELIKKHLSTGLSYSRAYGLSFNEITGTDIMSKSNNILAYNYISALKETKSDIKPFAVHRQGPSYNDAHHINNIASASKIRKLIYSCDDVSAFLPKLPSEEIFNLEKYFSLIKTIFIREDNYTKFFEYDEDTVNYMEKYIYDAKNYDEFMEAVSKKNFSRSKINRFLLSIFLKISKDDVLREKNYDFIVPLCANNKGKEILSEIKNKSGVSIISKYKDIYDLSIDRQSYLSKMVDADKLYYLMKDMDAKDAYKINLQSL